MTENHKEAERCIDTAARDFDSGRTDAAMFELARAQVYATLALVHVVARIADKIGALP